MILGTVLTPLNENNLRLAAQCGVEGVVVRYPGPKLNDLLSAKEMIEQHGLTLLAIEGYLPIEKIINACIVVLIVLVLVVSFVCDFRFLI